MYEIFTDALKNENIRSELIEAISSKTEENHIDGQTELFPRDDSAALAAENVSLSRKIALLELEAGRLESEKTALAAENKRCREALDEYSTAFAAQINLYKKYLTLSESTMKVVNGFFKNNSVSGLFLCGVQHDNLKGLRNYTERLAVEGCGEKRNDIAVLNELYVYLLSCYNSMFSEPVYRITDVKTGDMFDERLHHNTGTGKNGTISAVLLQGCICVSNSKVVRKAIVTL